MKKHFYPIFISLICVLVLLGGIGFFVFLTQHKPADADITVQVDSLAVVRLDDVWADVTFSASENAIWQSEITTMLDAVQAQGGNAVAMTGRLADGTALFRDATGSVATCKAVTDADRFFIKANPFADLCAAAAQRGMEVLLIPTQPDGSLLLASSLAKPASFVDALCKEYGLRLFAECTAGLGAASELDVGHTQLTNSVQSPDQIIAQYARSYQVSSLQADGWHADTTAYYIVSNPQMVALALAQVGQTVQQLLGNYDALTQSVAVDENQLLFAAYYNNGAALPSLNEYLITDYARTLAVAYPTENGASITTSKVFLMGTSNPDAALTMNGEPVPRFGTQGVWGVLVELAYGENTFSFVNGNDTLEYTVQRPRPSGGGGSNSGDKASYETLPVGQTIQITSAIASALSSAYDASSITQTLYQGAVAPVTQYVTYKGRDEAYAYQLTNGDWVRAASASLSPAGQSALLVGGVAFHDETRTSDILLTGGTPAVYHAWEDNTLTLTLLHATFHADALTSDWFTCTASGDGSKTTLTFTFSGGMPLYGWAVNYDTAANTTTISLKQAPTLSEDDTAPLAGVRVMLDAGHGLEDMGAMGAAGEDAPSEKHINLALTMATKHRLEQLGATVLLTRADDSFPTLGDRVSAMNAQMPDFFLSIHHNSLELVNDINQASGVEAYWFYNEGETLANDLITAISAQTGRNLRSAKYGYYYVTRSNICPATLLELGFMTNPAEYEDIVNVDTIWQEAGAIAQTIYQTVAKNG